MCARARAVAKCAVADGDADAPVGMSIEEKITETIFEPAYSPIVRKRK